MINVSKKAKRRLFFLFIIMIGVTVSLFGGVYKDWIQILENKKQHSELSKKYTSLLDEEKSLGAEVVKFQDPEYIARYAREKYLYSLPGELIIRIPKGNNN